MYISKNIEPLKHSKCCKTIQRIGKHIIHWIESKIFVTIHYPKGREKRKKMSTRKFRSILMVEFVVFVYVPADSNAECFGRK